MDTVAPDHRRVSRRIRTAAFIAVVVLLVGGFAIALMPALVFHSGSVTLYGRYPTVGMIVGLVCLIPANILAGSALRSRMSTSLLVVLLVVLNVVAVGILFLAFTFI